MSTPNNVLETISTDALVTATGGTQQPLKRELWQLSHLVKDAVSGQANTNANANSQATTLAMVAALAMRNR